jgi:hypothetical protein
LNHLAQVQPMLLERLQRFMTEDHPKFIPYIPEDDDHQTVVQLDTVSALEQISKYREQQVALLNGAEDATWKKTATHPEYEHYSLYILARHILMHDFWHMYRIEELWLTRDAFLTKQN